MCIYIHIHISYIFEILSNHNTEILDRYALAIWNISVLEKVLLEIHF